MIQYLDDRTMVEQLRAGDVNSFNQIFEKYHKKIYYFALRYLQKKEEAEDVVQEVFLNLWWYREQIKKDYTFNRYLFKITFNTICRYFRKQASVRKGNNMILKNLMNEDRSTDLEIEYDNLMEIAGKYIDKLPSKRKKVYLLRINTNLTTEEIARQLNISKKTVENHITRAKDFIKKSLVDENILSVLFFWLFLG